LCRCVPCCQSPLFLFHHHRACRCVSSSMESGLLSSSSTASSSSSSETVLLPPTPNNNISFLYQKSLLIRSAPGYATCIQTSAKSSCRPSPHRCLSFKPQARLPQTFFSPPLSFSPPNPNPPTPPTFHCYNVSLNSPLLLLFPSSQLFAASSAYRLGKPKRVSTRTGSPPLSPPLPPQPPLPPPLTPSPPPSLSGGLFPRCIAQLVDNAHLADTTIQVLLQEYALPRVASTRAAFFYPYSF
jgi:hypothetical protein